MLFTVTDGSVPFPPGISGRAYLIRDSWDDWFKFRTTFKLIIFGPDGARLDAGSVKIGQIGLLPSSTTEPGKRAPGISQQFDMLDDQFFSLGQDENYYETLNLLPEDFRATILNGLRDCAFNLQIFEIAQNEEVMRESLLRSVHSSNVRTRFHRLARGDAELTEFQFEYVFPSDTDSPPPILSFHAIPNSLPPTNVHVLIGRNGVGKTRRIRHITRALLGDQNENDPAGEIRLLGSSQDWSFAGLISVSFSAFDDFDLPEIEQPVVPTTLVGLRQNGTDPANPTVTIKTPQQLAGDFSKSFGLCRVGLRAERWRSAIVALENDPLLADLDVTKLLERGDDEWKDTAERMFSKLSSGHAIVLLTITRLVELVDERTLVLLDEPEGHLHPPLLSAFIRSLSDLLVKRNGVAIIATHSPVVLQEVPRSCVWKLRRSGATTVVERPEIETFGENVGVLTREVFRLEVTNSGFHKMIRQAIEVEGLSYDELIERFGGQLGAEARAVARGLIASSGAVTL